MAMSTCATEYVAIGLGAEFLLLLNELLLQCYVKVPVSIFCDNKTAILVMEDNIVTIHNHRSSLATREEGKRGEMKHAYV